MSRHLEGIIFSASQLKRVNMLIASMSTTTFQSGKFHKRTFMDVYTSDAGKTPYHMFLARQLSKDVDPKVAYHLCDTFKSYCAFALLNELRDSEPCQPMPMDCESEDFHNETFEMSLFK